MTIFSNTFGLALRNFTTWPELPEPRALIDYAVKAEALGFDSVWVWDHILLGVDPPFPILDPLTLLAAIAARTRRIKLGTGVLVLPLRNPVFRLGRGQGKQRGSPQTLLPPPKPPARGDESPEPSTGAAF